MSKTSMLTRVLAGICMLFMAIGGLFAGILMPLDRQEVFAEEKSKSAPKELSLYAQSAVLMDADTGRILYSKEGNEKKPNASTTKIMTCILALEQGNVNDLVTVSAYAASMPDVQLGMTEGEQYRLEDLLYSLMLESHNDSAVAIAEHIGGSVEGFAAKMNEKARALGCEKTFFVTPNGLDKNAEVKGADGAVTEVAHGTSAEDLARIMRYCVTQSEKREEFLTITRTPSYSFNNQSQGADGKAVPGARSFSCTNHNAYLSMDAGALSGKTGFTAKAGYCYVGALKSKDRIFVVALLACGWPNNKGYKWQDCKKLFGYGKKYYHYREIAKDAYQLQDVTIRDVATPDYQLRDGVSVTPRVSTRERVLLADWEEITFRLQYKKELEAPVQGTVPIGSMRVSVGDFLLEEQEISITAHVDKKDIPWYFKVIFQKWALPIEG